MRADYALLLLLAGLAPLTEAASIRSKLARAIVRRADTADVPFQPPFNYSSSNPGWSQNLIVDPSTTVTSSVAQPSAVPGDGTGNATTGDGSAPTEGEIVGNPNANPINNDSSVSSAVSAATTSTDVASSTSAASPATSTTAASTSAASPLPAGPTQPVDDTVPSDLAGIDIPSGAVPAVTGGADGNAGAATSTTVGESPTSAGEASPTTTSVAGENGGQTETPTAGDQQTTPTAGPAYSTGRRFRCRPKATTTTNVAGGEEVPTSTPCTTTTTTTPCTTTPTPCTTSPVVGGGEEASPTTTPCTKTKKKKTTTPCTTTTKTRKSKSRKMKSPKETGNANFQDVENQSNAMLKLLKEIQTAVDVNGLLADLKETTGASNFEFSALLSNLVSTINTKGSISVTDLVLAINDAAGGTDVSAEDIQADLVDSLQNGASESDALALFEKLADAVKTFDETELAILAQMIEKSNFNA